MHSGETMLELVTLDVKWMKKSNFLWAIRGKEDVF